MEKRNLNDERLIIQRYKSGYRAFTVTMTLLCVCEFLSIFVYKNGSVPDWMVTAPFYGGLFVFAGRSIVKGSVAALRDKISYNPAARRRMQKGILILLAIMLAYNIVFAYMNGGMKHPVSSLILSVAGTAFLALMFYLTYFSKKRDGDAEEKTD